MTDATGSSYAAALKQAEHELASHEERGQALRNTVDSLRALLALETPKAAPVSPPAPAKKARKPRKAQKPAKARKPRKAQKPAKMPRLRKPRRSAGAGHPPVGPNQYAGMGPTAAYRKFIAEFGPDEYTVPQIRDALVAGGVSSKSTTSLLTGLHSVRRRDEAKAQAAAAREAASK